ncbi:MAG: 7-carboxy-7-deazaguanine synthase QueE [Bacteroidota bacterium]|nr:7-carboxy-7-deazaguanine synthase QueE [Bacteroidota bacterium]
MNKLKVVEIFYSIQGEGANTGMPAIFIRLSGCNLNCWYCDTEWHQFTEMTVREILDQIGQYPCRNIIWTGGEPTLQLTDEILGQFIGYYHCIETNGTNPVPNGINYISCSPKVTPQLLKKNFSFIDEIRYPLNKGDKLPGIEELPPADHYLVSPLFLGVENKRMELSQENIDFCLDFVKNNPGWKLSIQLHKLLNIK